jgi:hypothetical protein
LAETNDCPKCKIRSRRVYSTGKVGPYCTECTKDYNAKKLEKKRAFVNQYKLERGCKQCGYNEHPVALELNHIDPQTKEFSIAKALPSVSMERLLKELEKCEVLCANCHQIHTYEHQHHLTVRS